MKNVFEPMLKIYETKGRNDKTQIVTDNKNNSKFLNLLKLGMDEYLVYGISEKSFEKFMDKTEFYKKPDELRLLLSDDMVYDETKYETFVNELIPYLSKTQSPSSEAITMLKNFFEGLNVIEKYFYYRIVIKNMNLGIGPKTINKAIGTLLIKQYTPMLADSGNEKFAKWVWGKDEKEEYYVDTKINGLRLSLFFNLATDEIIVKTRSGRRFKHLEEFLMENMSSTFKTSLSTITKEQDALYKEYGMPTSEIGVIDCELQHFDKTWESSISVINLDKIDIYKEDSNEPMFYLHCFDFINDIPFRPENFDVKTKTLPFSIRRTLIEKFINGLVTDHKCDKLFKVTCCELIDNLNEVETLSKKYISMSFEGSVVKKPSSIYWAGRGNEWIKIKDIVTYDGVIMEVMSGELSGKYNETTGKIRVKTTINGKEITGTCGSGFKDKDRDEIWKNKETIIGRGVEFTILGKTVKDNFQSGIFKNLRYDKNMDNEDSLTIDSI